MTPTRMPELFEDAETTRMGEAFQAAWEYIEESGCSLANPGRQEETRERLASAIIFLVRQVKPEIEALRDAALERLGFVSVEFIFEPARTIN